MAPSEAGAADADGPAEVGDAGAAIVTRGGGAGGARGLPHRHRVQGPPPEVHHHLAVEDKPLDGAVQPDDDAGLR